MKFLLTAVRHGKIHGTGWGRLIFMSLLVSLLSLHANLGEAATDGVFSGTALPEAASCCSGPNLSEGLSLSSEEYQS